MNDDVTRNMSAPRIPSVDDFPESGVNALATFPQRAWARVLDTVLVLYATYLIIGSFLTTDPSEDTDLTQILWVLFVWVAVAAAYEVTMVAVAGTTVGKIVLGTRVARFTDGDKPTVSQAALRCLLPLVAAAALILVLPIIGAAAVYLSALANPMLRGWHDQAAGTVVIRTR